MDSGPVHPPHSERQGDARIRYALPRRIKGDLLVADEYTPKDLYKGTPKTFKLDLVNDVRLMPEGWSPDFEWRERKHVDGDVVIEDVTTLKNRRDGCVGKAVVRKRRRGLLRWLFGE